MEGKIKEGADGQEQGDGAVVLKKRQHVTMGMEVLDCPVCYNPLSPPIFQCSQGHFLCSLCRDDIPGTEKACGVCSKPVSDRCHGMECVVASVLVQCPYAMHGCAADAMVYHEMAEHEAVCPHAPCFCPEKGCGFAGTTSALVDHFATRHKWPAKVFEYYVPVEVPVKAGVHVLYCRGGEDKDDDVFLLYVSHPESPLHMVSLVRVHPHETESKFGCSVGFSWFEGHYQVSTMDKIPTTSLSEGLPANYLFLVSEARLGGGGGRVVLRVTIDKEMVYGDNYDKLFEEDGDDESYIYDEEEDDDGSSEEEEDEDDSASSEEEEEDEDDNGSSKEEDDPKNGSSEEDGKEECGDDGADHSGL